MGKVLVGSLDGIHTFFKEVLLGLVEDHSGERGSIESYSGPEASDHTGQEELVEDGTVDGSEGPAVGSLLGAVFLDPAGKDASVGEDEDGLLEAFLELSDQFFIDGGEEEFAAAEVDVEEDEGLVLLEGVFCGLDNEQSCGELLALGIQVIDCFNNCASHLLFKMRKSLDRRRATAVLAPRVFSNTSAAFLVSVICD